MTARNLPTGFTEGRWEGWEMGGIHIYRMCKNGDELCVHKHADKPGYWRTTTWFKQGGVAAGAVYGEQAALDWAEKYAVENGGWA
ncbi:MAG: hypothetical protein JNK63_07885 [Chthonomonas sp.]|nr:hypothetical protein [Chthonomonas sp.]